MTSRKPVCEQEKAAERLNNPRPLRIGFHTLRHWKATMEYHRTRMGKSLTYGEKVYLRRHRISEYV